jgi:hypothetical protein
MKCFLWNFPFSFRGTLIIFLFSFFVSWEFSSAADDVSSSDPIFFGEIETLPLRIQPFLDISLASIYMGSPDLGGYAYVPNSAPRAGLTFAYKRFKISYASNLPLPPEEISRRGNTTQSTFVLQTWFRSFAFELYSQAKKGLYAGNPLTEVDVHRAEIYSQFPSGKIRNQGITFYFSSRPESFSFENSFAQRHIQKKSGSGLALVPFFQNFEFESGNEVLPGKETNPIRQLPSMRKINFLNSGLMIGPGYHWVFDESGYYLALQWVVGPGLQLQSWNELGKNDYSSQNFLAKTNINGFLGYNDKTKTFGLQIFAEGIYSRIYSTDTYSTLILPTIFYGQRF